MFVDTARKREFEVRFKNKFIKTIFNKYADIEQTNVYFVGEKLAVFNENGWLEIAIYRGNTHTVGSANSLLGLIYRDVITIEFN